ncbi:MAG: LamG domain-containing protein [Limnohabitans sp.]|nr:LamG domain-containing protein [Limnohabitans sp.]
MKNLYMILCVCLITFTYTKAQVSGTPYIVGITDIVGLDFDGINDFVTVGNTTVLNGLSSYTIEYWGRFANFNQWTTMISKMHAIYQANRSAHIQFGSSDGEIYAFIGDSYNYTINKILPNQWTHIAVVFDGSQAVNSDRLKIYFNGVLQPIINVGAFPATVPSNSGSFTIGTECNTTSPMNSSTPGIGLCDMTMAELRVWNLAKTQAQITASKDSFNIPITSPGLMLYYSMNQGIPNGNNTGLTTLTESVSGINGTLYNFGLNGSISNFILVPF